MPTEFMQGAYLLGVYMEMSTIEYISTDTQTRK